MKSTQWVHAGRRREDYREDTKRIAHPGGIKCVGVTADGVYVMQIIPAHFMGGHTSDCSEDYCHRRMQHYRRKAHAFRVSRYKR